MNFTFKGTLLLTALSLITFIDNAQVTLPTLPSLPSGISGNAEIDGATYNENPAIGAPKVNEKFLSNAFINLLYSNGPFTAGARYESYANVMQGYDARYNGHGVMYRYVEFAKNELTITAGSFYEQFGSGLTLRTYFEPGLGVDNFIDGVRAKYSTHGITLKGFVGRQRSFFTYGDGLLRGLDGEVNLNELVPKFKDAKNIISIGGSYVSKYQDPTDPVYNLPANVATGAGRINFNRGGFNLFSEYAYKANDPSLVNNYIYKDGQALYVTAGYSVKGLGFNITGKRLDNMSFRSDRNATLTNLNINYLPAVSHQYTYRLATLYPYATQPNGEMGGSAELYYTFQPNTPLGGHYGTQLSINTTQVNSIQMTPTGNELGYTSDFLKPGNTVYYSDVNIELSKKFNKKFKAILSYMYEQYNQAVVEGHPDTPMVFANIIVLEMQYKFSSSKALRAELQHLSTKEDRGNWAFALLEYTISPGWSFNVFDEYNYGNPNSSLQLHYPSGGVAYFKNSMRIALGYGKQRSGLLCVGGVCRYVPASDGFTFSITTSF